MLKSVEHISCDSGQEKLHAVMFVSHILQLHVWNMLRQPLCSPTGKRHYTPDGWWLLSNLSRVYCCELLSTVISQETGNDHSSEKVTLLTLHSGFSGQILFISAARWQTTFCTFFNILAAVQTCHPLKTFGALWNEKYDKGSKLLKRWNLMKLQFKY